MPLEKNYFLDPGLDVYLHRCYGDSKPADVEMV